MACRSEPAGVMWTKKETDEILDEATIIELQFNARLEKRVQHPELPDTVTVLETGDGGRVYIVGTAHFSHESQEDVSKTISAGFNKIILHLYQKKYQKKGHISFEKQSFFKNSITQWLSF